MNERSRPASAWTRTCHQAAFVVLVLGGLIPASGQEAKRSVEPARLLPNTPDEPVRPVASLAEAATFLDRVALDWTRQRKCGTCHTNYPYLVARPVLKEPAPPAMVEVRRFFEGRVAHWDHAEKGAKPLWDAEVVSTAAALAMNDAATTGKLHALTRRALDRVWTL